MAPRREDGNDAPSHSGASSSSSGDGHDSDIGPRQSGKKRKLTAGEKSAHAKRTQEKRQIQLTELEGKIEKMGAANEALSGKIMAAREGNATLQADIDSINAQCRALKEENDGMKAQIQVLKAKAGDAAAGGAGGAEGGAA